MARVAKSSSTLAGRSRVYALALVGLLILCLALTRTSWALVGLLALGLVSALFDRFTSTFSGTIGESKVARYLRTLPDSWVILNDITIKAEAGSAQIDHLLVTPTGIILIETKNHRGLITAKGRTWMQHLGRSKSEFYSPVNQAQGHERVLKAILGLRGLQTPLKSYVVFTNSDAKLSVPREVFGISVVTLAELRRGIEGPAGQQMTAAEVRELTDLLVAADSPTLTLVDRVARRISRGGAASSGH